MHPKVFFVRLLLLAMPMFICAEGLQPEASLLDSRGRLRRSSKKGEMPNYRATGVAKSQVGKAFVAMLRDKDLRAQIDPNEPLRRLLNAQLSWDTTYLDVPGRVTYFAIRGFLCDPYCFGFVVSGKNNEGERATRTDTHGELHYPSGHGFQMLSLRKGRHYEKSPADIKAELNEFFNFLEDFEAKFKIAKPENMEGLLFLQSAEGHTTPDPGSHTNSQSQEASREVEVIAHPNQDEFTYEALQAAVRLEKDSDTFETFRSLVANSAGLVGINHYLPYNHKEQSDRAIGELCRQVADALPYFDDTRFPNFWPTREALKMHLENYQAKHTHKPASGRTRNPASGRTRKPASGRTRKPASGRTRKPRRGGRKKNRRSSGPQPASLSDHQYEDEPAEGDK
ncbi:hypothetical protein BDP27DRAFT_1410934 [Rhodocollybia butyracea]|uniref:Uncharacterized protein n=1 Tax=Rhodocollybia butyracea TaxID=206335 RepID=A0A9P5P4P1_9AGAR|nr:hypothetical protein BDP27DRAFT_1410934 [Rhodocollybia butyracea]